MTKSVQCPGVFLTLSCARYENPAVQQTSGFLEIEKSSGF
jgi:hypothetical protein